MVDRLPSARGRDPAAHDPRRLTRPRPPLAPGASEPARSLGGPARRRFGGQSRPHPARGDPNPAHPYPWPRPPERQRGASNPRLVVGSGGRWPGISADETQFGRQRPRWCTPCGRHPRADAGCRSPAAVLRRLHERGRGPLARGAAGRIRDHHRRQRSYRGRAHRQRPRADRRAGRCRPRLRIQRALQAGRSDGRDPELRHRAELSRRGAHLGRDVARQDRRARRRSARHRPVRPGLPAAGRRPHPVGRTARGSPGRT